MQRTSTLRVNLLPWREQARQKKRRQWYARAWVAFGLGLALVVIMHFYLSFILGNQAKRNQFLQQAITTEQADITNLSKKSEHKTALLQALNTIVSLRQANYETITFLNQIATVVPASIDLTRIAYTPLQAILEGNANNNADITQFMQQLAKSDYFTQPVLSSINNKSSDNNQLKFQLKVRFKDKAA